MSSTPHLDTGALFALQNRRDTNHAQAVACYEEHAGETFALHPLILAEAWYLCEQRLGTSAARKVASAVGRGELVLLMTEPADIVTALKIERSHAALQMGLTDAVTIALCERHRIRALFSFDRRDFGPYLASAKPSFALIP